ncbi:NUDIX domain-containing protein [Kineosporia sp. J2-2]|uniref:NUDIX domain-containing protein n=1 Tax=Kineosporia corallincola TaxID=2835133 RepID=A0ABS5TTT5_9ACTN|nr:NUDIX domain-containing protein [Kineosporia corallincola]MBT0774228.1 NUDIX domain-containing protein [Kineosporia corallincola]
MTHPQLIERSAGYFEYWLPVSLKAVINWNGLVPLLKNERDEWELPGGKLEMGEELAVALEREVREELSWDVEIGKLLTSWVYVIRPDRHVFVVSYSVTYEGGDEPRCSHEHKELKLFRHDQVSDLNMPDPYKEAISLAFQRDF